MREEKKVYANSHKIEKSEYDKIYRSVNKEKIAKNKKDWEFKNKDNVDLKIKRNLRRRLNHFVSGSNKSKRTLELLGCDLEFFKNYISNLFTEGMTWDNYGEWHIDHIKPCSLFDLIDHSQQEQCFIYTNLQPLWAIDNFKKSNKYD